MAPASDPVNADAGAPKPEGPDSHASADPAAELPNPLLEDQEPGRRLAGRQQESDTGRHAVDRSRPEAFVRKTR